MGFSINGGNGEVLLHALNVVTDVDTVRLGAAEDANGYAGLVDDYLRDLRHLIRRMTSPAGPCRAGRTGDVSRSSHHARGDRPRPVAT